MGFTLRDFTGIIPAIMTPFDKNGRYDPACSKEMIDWMIAQGATGFYLTGSNGQGPFMDSSERMEVVETMTGQVAGRVPVVAHIGAVSARHSAEMARHASCSGCTGVSAVPSYYVKLNLQEMKDYYREIAEASDVPLVIYSQPHINPSVELFQTLAQIPNIKGLKFTGPDHYMMGRIKAHLGPDFMVYSGTDEMLLSGQIMGADGAIGGTYNVMPDLYIRCRNEFWRGDVISAQRDMLAANAILEVLFRYELSAAMRACLGFAGVNAGRNPHPIHTLEPDETASLKKDLQRLKAALDIPPIALFDAI